MAEFRWEDMTAKWRELYEEQAKVAAMWRDSQTQLARAMVGMEDTDAGSAGGAAAFADLWRAGMQMAGADKLPGFEPGGGVASAALSRMLEPLSLSLMGGSQVGDLIRTMTEGPRLADVGSMERRIAQVMELYVEVQTAARAFETLVAGAWMEANQTFAATMAKRIGGAETVEPKEAMKVWLGVADEALTRTHRSPAFLEAQRRLLRAGMDFLLAERELVETLIEPTGLPTRSEIDELHQTVHTLKREVRALRRADSSRAPSRTKEPASGSRSAAGKASKRSTSSTSSKTTRSSKKPKEGGGR